MGEKILIIIIIKKTWLSNQLALAHEYSIVLFLLYCSTSVMRDSAVAATWTFWQQLQEIQNRWKTNQPAYILDENVENLMGKKKTPNPPDLKKTLLWTNIVRGVFQNSLYHLADGTMIKNESFPFSVNYTWFKGRQGEKEREKMYPLLFDVTSQPFWRLLSPLKIH